MLLLDHYHQQLLVCEKTNVYLSDCGQTDGHCLYVSADREKHTVD